jgi:ABC-type antimicrobial peptide transport system permease subunit
MGDPSDSRQTQADGRWCVLLLLVTIAFVIATITAVAVGASWLPAWRASRQDPNVVLREE